MVPAAPDQGLAVGHRPVGRVVIAFTILINPSIRKYAVPIIFIHETVNSVNRCFRRMLPKGITPIVIALIIILSNPLIPIIEAAISQKRIPPVQICIYTDPIASTLNLVTKC